jgi:hypothetical protein
MFEPSPAARLYIELGITAIIFIGTVINIHLHFHGHRHNAKDIDITIRDMSYSSGRDFYTERPLNILWSKLLNQLKINIEINPIPKEDLLITDTSKPYDTVTEGILNTIKNMPYSKVQELLSEIDKLLKSEKANIDGAS